MIRIGRAKEEDQQEPSPPVEVSLTIRVGRPVEESPADPMPDVDEEVRQDEYLRDQAAPERDPREDRPLTPLDYYKWLRMRILHQQMMARRSGSGGFGGYGMGTGSGGSHSGGGGSGGGGTRGAGQGA